MYHYTALDEDLFTETNSSSQDFWVNDDSAAYHSPPIYTKEKKPLREKNSGRRNSGYKHVPHRDKPPQVVEKRNARERRRVQAVNGAFVRLRNAVPIQNTRGKRISKVKTLLYAMEYIRALDKVLQDCAYYESSYEMIKYEEFRNACGNSSDNWSLQKDNGHVLKYLG